MLPESNLIVMLTHHDLTVKNALEIFEECRNLPVKYWGFKNVGIPEDEMLKLLAAMKEAGKKVLLEVVTYTEQSCMAGAKFACNHNFDYLLGTVFYPRVWDYLKGRNIQYFPFVGSVSGSPSVLRGSSESMIREADELHQRNIPGVNVLAYRYANGNPVHLAETIVKSAKSKTVIAGSIDSVERIKTVKSINPWGFTMGSALFAQKFVKEANVKQNLERVLTLINAA
jgi:hypothetical protein